MNDRLLTPEYAAPEQILGQPVTTSSDVYALGTVLYELLTGFRPFVVPATTTQLELERLICVSDPIRPSSAITRGLARPDEENRPRVVDVATARDISADRLARRLRGDLDAICMRALRKEPQHRYATVEQLADDVRRYLAREPVVARQGNWFYYSQRFIRRHAVAVSAATLLVTLIIAFAVVMSLQAQRIANERDRATQESARAETVSSFMLDVFGAADPYVHQGDAITAQDLLDAAAARIAGDLARQPEVRARLLEAIGIAYRRQGFLDKAVVHLQEAVQLRRSLPSTVPHQLAELLRQLGIAERDRGEFERAMRHLAAASQLVQHQPDSVLHAEILVDIARVEHRIGNWQEALKGFEQALTVVRKAKGSTDLTVAEILVSLTSIHAWRADFPAAERTAREALAIYEARVKPTHPERVLAEFQLGEVLTAVGRIDEASTLLERVLETRRTLYGQYSSEVADSLESLARIRLRQNRIDDAERLARQALAAQERALGTDHFMTGYQHTSLSLTLLRAGKLDAAEEEARTGLAIYRAALEGDHQYIAAAEHLLGEILIAQGEYADAEQLLREARARWERAGAPSWRMWRSTSALGEAIYLSGRRDEARPMLIESYNAVANDMSAPPEARAQMRDRVQRFARPRPAQKTEARTRS